MGLGGLIIVAAIVRIRHGGGLLPSPLPISMTWGNSSFGFCLLWADFFYCQFLVIWYGNIPEETSYIIQRTMTLPWSRSGVGCLHPELCHSLSHSAQQAGEDKAALHDRPLFPGSGRDLAGALCFWWGRP